MNTSKLTPLVASVLFVLGCNDSQEHQTTTAIAVEEETYQAQVIDGYLRDALVWLDLNGNLKQDAHEPHIYSSINGNAELDVSQISGNPEQYSLAALVIKHKTVDEDHGEIVGKTYLMVAPPGVRIISPLTHLINTEQIQKNITVEQAIGEVRKLTDQSHSIDLVGDYVKADNKKLHALARSFAVVMDHPTSQQELISSHSKLTAVAEALHRYSQKKSDDNKVVDFDAVDLSLIANDDEIGDDVEMLSWLFSERDTDNDGITDGIDTDDDGDGIEDVQDVLPRDPLESKDSDSDGIGDWRDNLPYEANTEEKVIKTLVMNKLQEQINSFDDIRNKVRLENSGTESKSTVHASADSEYDALKRLLSVVEKSEQQAKALYANMLSSTDNKSSPDIASPNDDSTTTETLAITETLATTETLVTTETQTVVGQLEKIILPPVSLLGSKVEGNDISHNVDLNVDNTSDFTNTDELDLITQSVNSAIETSTTNPKAKENTEVATVPAPEKNNNSPDIVDSDTDAELIAIEELPKSVIAPEPEVVIEEPQPEQANPEPNNPVVTPDNEALASSLDGPMNTNTDPVNAVNEADNANNSEVVVDTTKLKDEPVVLSDFDKLQQRILADSIAEEQKRSKALNKTVANLADSYIGQQKSDGSWYGINYVALDGGGSPAAKHIQLTRTIAVAYSLTHKDIYKQAVIKALEYWFIVTPPNANLSWQYIGKPYYLASIVFLLGDDLTTDLVQQVIESLPVDLPINMTRTTQIDIALGILTRGILSQDDVLVYNGLSIIENLIEITIAEGIQPDDSFHHHDAQLYSGKFGEDFLNSSLKWAYNVRDLRWAFSQQKVDILAGMMLDGMRWMTRSGQLDYNVLGLYISDPKPEPYVQEIPEVTMMDMVAELVPQRLDEAMKYEAHVYENAPSGLSGFKSFWRSDYSVTAGNEFMLGIKMNSNRTVSSENCGGRNLKGYWLGFGSTFLMQSGKEYYNIFPAFDWAKVPGVTAPEYQEAPPYCGGLKQETTFVGSAGNGSVGVTTMAMNVDITHLERINSDPLAERGQRTLLLSGGGNTQAKKSWFSFGDQIVALGAGISSTHSQPVQTTINQTLFNGAITMSNGGEFSEGIDYDVSTSRWVHHDGVGYLFLDDSPRTVSNKLQSGSWSEIQQDAPSKLVSKQVFTLSIPHGVKPEASTYQYVILPDRTVQQMGDYHQNMRLRVIQNTPQIQAVEHSALNITGAVFHQPGSLEIAPNYKVSVDKPCVLLLDSSGPDLTVTLSTPGEAYSVVDLSISFNGGNQTRRVVTPGTSALMGNAITFSFATGQDIETLDDPLAKQALDNKPEPSIILSPIDDGFVQGGELRNINYGSSGYMQLKNGEGHLHRLLLMQFDISAIQGIQVPSATLRIYIRGIINKGGTKSAVVARSVLATPWSESQLTYTTFPQLSIIAESDPIQIGESAKGSWVEIDVTSTINQAILQQQSQKISISLADLTSDYEENYISFATKEHAGAEPQLVFKGVSTSILNSMIHGL